MLYHYFYRAVNVGQFCYQCRSGLRQQNDAENSKVGISELRESFKENRNFNGAYI